MNDPASTKETFHQGWMRTGDVLRADEEGFFYLTDRKKELIKYKGSAILLLPPLMTLSDGILKFPSPTRRAGRYLNIASIRQ